MRLKTNTRAPNREPDLTGLINVIFLILIFFMIAGTLRPFSERNLKLARTIETTAATPRPGHLIARADGTLVYRGGEPALSDLPAILASDAALDRDATFTFIADARLDARNALEVISVLKSAGLRNVSLLTERRAP